MQLYYYDLDHDVLILAADGGLNSDTADQFVEDLERIASAGIAKLVIDCSNLTLISSRGLRTLLTIHSRMKSRGPSAGAGAGAGEGSGGGASEASGCDVRIAGAKNFVLDTMRVAHLDRLFALYSDVNAAVLSFRPRSASAKKDLRARAKAALSELDPSQRERWCERITERLVRTDLIPGGQGQSGADEKPLTIMVYAPMLDSPEVDLTAFAELIARAPPTGRSARLCVPRVDWKSRTMTPALVSNLTSDLVVDTERPELGLRVPRADAPEIAPEELDAVILPGLAFDYAGNRLGRGAGLYDRFLAELASEKPVRIGVAFDIQLADSVPTDAHDQRLHAIVTPTLSLRFV